MKVEITDFTLVVTEIVLTTSFVGSFFKITANSQIDARFTPWNIKHKP